MRLIDADTLINDIEELITEHEETMRDSEEHPENYPENYETRVLNLIAGLIAAKVEVDYAPTIDAKTKCVARIEVDTEEVVKRIKEEYDIMDGWIPVSERLPNKNEWGYYLVTVKGTRLFVDVVPFNEKLWKGLSSNQEVLAWMPLPKPYREDDEA